MDERFEVHLAPQNWCVRDELDDWARCPVCWTLVPDEDARSRCPACACDVNEAGGWQ